MGNKGKKLRTTDLAAVVAYTDTLEAKAANDTKKQYAISEDPNDARPEPGFLCLLSCLNLINGLPFSKNQLLQFGF